MFCQGQTSTSLPNFRADSTVATAPRKGVEEEGGGGVFHIRFKLDPNRTFKPDGMPRRGPGRGGGKGKRSGVFRTVKGTVEHITVHTSIF